MVASVSWHGGTWWWLGPHSAPRCSMRCDCSTTVWTASAKQKNGTFWKRGGGEVQDWRVGGSKVEGRRSSGGTLCTSVL